MPEPHATPRSAARHRPAGHHAHHRTGELDLDDGHRRRARATVTRAPRLRQRSAQSRVPRTASSVPAPSSRPAAPARRQPKTCCGQTCQRRATSDTRAPGTRRLLDDPCLLLRRPASAPPRSRQNLNPPKSALRVVINVEHNDSSKPSASSTSAHLSHAQKKGGGPPLTVYASSAFLRMHTRRELIPPAGRDLHVDIRLGTAVGAGCVKTSCRNCNKHETNLAGSLHAASLRVLM